MLKGGLPPIIALSIYQSTSVASTFSTLGYLTAIVSILGFAIMPRAKFLQTMSINLLAICLGSAIALLQCWSGVKARQHTEPVGLPPARYRYNGSQSAVCGVWLFAQIWGVNSVKARFPQLAFPAVLYSIFANIASTSGASFQTTAQVEAFVQRLLEAFLTGFAIATGTTVLEESGKEGVRPEIKEVKEATGRITMLHGKLGVDLPFAKREVAYGRLEPEDYEAMFKNLRAVMMPLVGVTSVIDIFERLAELNGWEEEEEEGIKQEVMEDWHHLMTYAHDPIQNILDTMDGGLEHIAIRLQLSKPPKKKKGADASDIEAKGDQIKPGDKEFASHFETQANDFYAGRDKILHYWLTWKGISPTDDFFALESNPNVKLRDVESKHRQQRQLFLVLHIIFLLHSISVAILTFVTWADAHDQSTAKKHLITPGKKRFRKWLASIFSTQDSNSDDETTNVGLNRAGVTIHMGDAYRKRKDPDHLPPTNAWQRFGESLRKVAGFLRSSESAFGFRVACATMSIAIVAYLGDTQLWFTRQRVVWAMLMVALGMTPTSGLAMFNFVWRIFGTLVAMLAAWLVWYIPNENTAGILVVLYIFISAGHWVPLKRIDLIIPGLISMVTCVMIIGYELQVRKIGEQVATSNGQPYYKIIVLGPYRLATVTAGIGVAFFWTVMHETVMARIRGDGGDAEDKANPSYALVKARNKVFAKQMLALQALKQHSAMVAYEFPLGGKFPKEEYDGIIACISNITNYAALLGLASATFLHPSLLEPTSTPTHLSWYTSFRTLLLRSSPSSHEITSLLSLLSSSVTNGTPLPPYLRPPTAYRLSTELEQVDKGILSVKNVGEPGYAAFAVLQISTRCIQMDVERLLEKVRGLVGVMDFSFHVVDGGSEETVGGGEGKAGKED
ncbi:hypothetical protein GRF29_28g106573 [Pseudopithomyces chartarum]|uniref:ER transporter 6TM N-terminal domain-containing protein n=1 Tax=Pseudopithomyces chartarum TaxID=1892770 RepID=A0AAN6LZ66_9PLEO|nr:hypothetical protein GRF29_28g106573 [Pseudopithomyces chartarum]